jgi:hypothetical protein
LHRLLLSQRRPAQDRSRLPAKALQAFGRRLQVQMKAHELGAARDH